jgi:hypothetical protein
MLTERRHLLERLLKLDVDMLEYLMESRADRGAEVLARLP